MSILDIFFPNKCVLCRRVLPDSVTDICTDCRNSTDEFPKPKRKISCVAGWTSLWYYSGAVRHSIVLYKFYGRRSYGPSYGRLLSEKLRQVPFCDCDLITWVPTSFLRRWRRGYDQVELIATGVGQCISTPIVPVLKKLRHTKPQSRLDDPSRRRANVFGVFAVTDPALVAGKRILLLDDIITTGATVSECARILLTAGAKEVYCAAVAASHDKKEKRR